jgi:hypothetical protein
MLQQRDVEMRESLIQSKSTRTSGFLVQEHLLQWMSPRNGPFFK